MTAYLQGESQAPVPECYLAGYAVSSVSEGIYR